MDLRGDADLGEINVIEQRSLLRIRDIKDGRRLERGADPLLRAFQFKRAGDDPTNVADLIPFVGKATS